MTLSQGFWTTLDHVIGAASRLAAPVAPRPSGERLSVYIARLGDDDLSEASRERVIASIQHELGALVEILPLDRAFEVASGVSAERSAERANADARALLWENGGDLLIWGRVYAVPGFRPQLDLRFVSQYGSRSRPELFAFTDGLMLDAAFGPELGLAIAALAASTAEQVGGGQFGAEVFAPIADRLAVVIRSFPSSMRAKDRAQLTRSYLDLQIAIGRETSNSTRLRDAVAASRILLSVLPPEEGSSYWALAKEAQARALAILGESTRDEALVSEAIEAYRSALEVFDLRNDPHRWAVTQANLAAALRLRSGGETGTAYLEEAIAHYRAVEEVFTRDRLPDEWALLQMNQGTALGEFALRTGQPSVLDEGIRMLRIALEESSGEAPHRRATMQYNLARLLSSAGQVGGDEARLLEAVDVGRLALRQHAGEGAWNDWARTQTNLGANLRYIAERRPGTQTLEEALDAYRSVLTVWTREASPLDWAMTQANVGNTLSLLDDRSPDNRWRLEAAAAFREALKVQTLASMPFEWALRHFALGRVLAKTGKAETGSAQIRESIASFRSALQVATLERYPESFRDVQYELASALKLLAQREGSTQDLASAVEAYRLALAGETRPDVRASVQEGLDDALRTNMARVRAQ